MVVGVDDDEEEVRGRGAAVAVVTCVVDRRIGAEGSGDGGGEDGKNHLA